MILGGWTASWLTLGLTVAIKAGIAAVLAVLVLGHLRRKAKARRED